MIYSGIFPLNGDKWSGSRYLNSAGEIYLEAIKDGEKLLVRNGFYLGVEKPFETPQLMNLFEGRGEEFPPDGEVSWSFSERQSLAMDTVASVYISWFDSLRWYNIDYYINFTPSVECKFYLNGISDSLNSSNAKAYAILKDENSAFQFCYYYGSIENNIALEKSLPMTEMNVVFMSVLDGQLYFGMLDLMPEMDSKYQIQMDTISPQRLDNLLENLP